MSQPEAPQPSDQHQRMAVFEGEWHGAETMYPPGADEGITVESRVQSRMELGGWFLFMGYAQLQDGQAGYMAHGIMGYDHAGSEVTFYWFDSQGWNPTNPFRGTWDGDTLVLEIESENGHDRITYEFSPPDQYKSRVENSADGGNWKTLVEGTFKRIQKA